ncbi:DUF1499 domain-containing protein [Leptospira sp. GIMC2001]|uniref:DUF1499 domain-containing protein n=1 Tax=Leptospira sp. GIMC2001 TaxID=1513297 RepID=UPI002349934C|nr:DUF1499 domain-containing protein [Leptospira sp. GIMC2001]WCL48332.1 DUF1499 domain-containing protein [Leptospira sp. GIMC2001]
MQRKYIATILINFSIALLAINCSGTRPSDLGVNSNGMLKECPSSPNCVSSFCEPTDEHYLAPISYTTSTAEAKQQLLKVIESSDRTEIVVDSDNYIHAEYTSKLMRYVDDVEFYFDDKTKKLHFRSASRLGKSDFGVNRERIETIQSKLGWK